MNEHGAAVVAEAVAGVAVHELLTAVVDALLAQDAVELAGPVALERVRSLLADVGRVQVAVLAGIDDVDRRQLFALDAAGGTRSWLRRLPGGEDGQLARARELAAHPGVRAAVAGQVSPRSAHRVCAALDAVPADLGEEVTVGLLRDGIAPVLVEATGGVPWGADAVTEARVLARQGEDDAVIAGCVRDRLACAGERVEPALVLLARRVSPGALPHVLNRLLDGIRDEDPDRNTMRYFVRLRALWGGDWDLRGVLDPETGALLAERLNARTTPSPDADTAAGDTDAAAGDAAAEESSDGAEGSAGEGSSEGGSVVGARGEAGGELDLSGELDLGLAPAPATPRRRAVIAPTPGVEADPVCEHPHDPWHAEGPGASARDCPRCGPGALFPAAAAHNALRDLLRHHRAHPPGATAQAVPTALTVVATLASLCGVPGAPPAMLHHRTGRPVPIPAATAARLGCDSELAAIVLSAAGTPIGASHTARSATGAQRRALRAAWGPHCAVHGCDPTRHRPPPCHPLPPLPPDRPA
ncbi:MAG: hypothetical protein ABI181_07620 [Mycobacteriaceae bacterium]